MLDEENIDHQQKLLEIHRRTLAHSLEQYRALGVLATPALAHNIREMWTNIAQIKATLRAQNVDVTDEPIDQPYELHITIPTLTPTERRNRQRMLQRVREFWIKGVLENSLHGAVLIELGMEYKPDAVQHPWDMVIQQPDQPARSILPGTKIIDVFDEFGGELLILGAPGSGKTTMLLELARDLIMRAERDDNYPIPVVFNLSSWAEKRYKLAEWLVDELTTKYDVPKKIGKAWVDADQVLPLLDGLDEMKQEHSEACVEAINAFRRDHGLVSLVVCSRITDYDALTAMLKLQGAIVVQPLTKLQVDMYLNQIGSPRVAVPALLHDDETLWQLLDTPLMLSVMTLTYRGQLSDILSSGGTVEKQQDRLFRAYVEAMLRRRGVEKRYSQAQMVGWLSWLAKGMAQQGQSLFLLEQLQADWLSTRAARIEYGIVDRLWWAGIFGLLGAIGGMFVGGLILNLTSSDLGAVLGGLLGMLIVGLFGGRKNEQVSRTSGSIGIARNAVLGYVVIGLGLGVGYLFSGRRTGVVSAFGTALIAGLAGGVMGALTGRPTVRLRYIRLVEVLQWSGVKAIRASLAGLILGLCGGLGVGLLVRLGSGILRSAASTRSIELGEALIHVFGGIPGFMLLGGLGGALVMGSAGGWIAGELERRVRPNQGIGRSLRSALLTGIIAGVGAAPLGAFVFGFGYEVLQSLGSPLRLILGGALLAMMVGGFLGALAGCENSRIATHSIRQPLVAESRDALHLP